MSTVPDFLASVRKFRLRLSPRARKLTGRILAVLLVVWLSVVGFIFWAMNQTPEKFGAVMKHMPWPVVLVLPFATLWNQARGDPLQVDKHAPDLTLTTLHRP